MSLPNLPVPTNQEAFDVLVYEGTASGFGAAVAAAKEGKKVAFISEFISVGGMINSGVSLTDMGIAGLSNSEKIPNLPGVPGSKLLNGLFNLFTENIISYYNGTDGTKYEPSAATAVLNNIIQNAGNISLLSPAKVISVETKSSAISKVCFKNTETNDFISLCLNSGGYVIDASNNADLAFLAGVKTFYGREGKNETGETFAGSLYFDNSATANNKYQFLNSKDFPSTFEGDKNLPAYAYLMCIKDYGETAPNLLKTPPPNYDEKNYQDGSTFQTTWTYFPGNLPNNKYEVNVQPKGPDLQEANFNFPNGDRDKIREAYKNHALGYLYFIQNVWNLKNFGLAEDEYTDNDNFPIRLYVREGRKIEGLYKFQEQDILSVNLEVSENGDFLEISGKYKEDNGKITKRAPLHFDSVSYLSYAFDSHATEKFPAYTVKSPSKGNGEFFISSLSTPADLPLRIMIPEKGPNNLIASQSVSATHVGFSGIRLESIRMGLGQAAGVMASKAVEQNLNNQQIFNSSQKDYWNFLQTVQSSLVSENHKVGIHFYNDVSYGDFASEAIQIMSLWGIFSSFDNYQFLPDDVMSTADFIKTVVLLIERFKDYVAIPTKLNEYKGFEDVKESDWFYSFVKKAVQWGLISNQSSSDCLNPNKDISPSEGAKIINNFYQTDLNENSFSQNQKETITRAECANVEYQVICEKVFKN